MKGKKATVREIRAKLTENAEARKAIFRQLLNHIEQGYSIDSFGVINDETIRTYLKTYKDEFIQEDLEHAIAKGKAMWESIGKQQAQGHCLGNSRTWFYNMSNRYNWSEKAQVQTDQKHSVNVNVVNYSTKKGSTT